MRARRIIRWFAGMCLACYGLVQPLYAQSGELSGIRTVVVVPRLGNVLHIEETGFTVFDREDDRADISAWHLQDGIRAGVEHALQRSFQIAAPTTSPELADCTDVESCSAALPPTGNADAYVLVFPIEAQGFSPRDKWTGIGVFHVPGPFSRLKSVIHVLYGVALIDGKTGRVIRHVDGRLPEATFWGEHEQPIRELDASTWPGDAAHLTEPQREALRTAVVDLLNQSIPYTMSQLFAP